MAIQGGPDIVEDGLVLHLDAAEPLCFRGEPTTNVVANSIPDANWFVGNYGGSTVTRSDLIEDNIPFMRFSNVNVPTGGTYPRINNSSMTSTITGTFSASLEARGTEGAVVNFNIYSSGYTRVSFAVTLTSEWTRYEFTTTTAYNLDTPYFQPRATGATYDIRNIQIEAKPYSTPFVVGTRGSTVATGGGLLDLTNNGNNGTINRAASPSAAFYNGDNKGSLVFNGVNDYASLTTNIFKQTLPNFSISVWFNNTTNGALLTNHFGGSTWSSVDAYTTIFIVNAFNNNTTNRQILNFTSPPLNTWSNLTFVNNSSSGYMKVFYNTNEIANKIATVIPWNSDVLPTIGAGLAINGGIGNQINGKIAQLSVYNKALNPQEIQQNYNATKGRFGL